MKIVENGFDIKKLGNIKSKISNVKFMKIGNIIVFDCLSDVIAKYKTDGHLVPIRARAFFSSKLNTKIYEGSLEESEYVSNDWKCTVVNTTDPESLYGREIITSIVSDRQRTSVSFKLTHTIKDFVKGERDEGEK